MRPGKVIDVCYLVGASFLIIIGFAVYISFQSLLEKSRWVDHSNKVIFASEQILSLMKDAQTGQRGYIITGDAAYLKPYFNSIDSVKLHVAHLRDLTAEELDHTVASTQQIIFLTIILTSAFAIFTFFYIKKQIHKKAQFQEDLHNLNMRINSVNKELATTNEELAITNEELLSSNEELFTVNEKLQTANEQLHSNHSLLNEYSAEIGDLYNNAPCGYHSTDESGNFLNINDTELKWLGYTREEVIGKMKLMDIISPKGAVIIKATHDQFIEKGYLENLESEMMRKDGSVFPILANVTYIKDNDGKSIKTHATIFDITGLKKVQQKLIESEYNYKLMAENITDMISRHHADGTYFYASPSAKRLLGYNPLELTGKSAYELVHTDDLQEVKRMYTHFSEVMDVITVEYRIRRKDGHYIWFETVSKFLRDPLTHDIREILSVSRNVSVRKDYEEKLKSANCELENIKSELEYRVRERTEKLNYTLKELQTRNHELDNYVYKVSHDLRAPLVSILGLVNLTKLDSDICAIKHYLNLIENRVNKSDEFIKSVLSHSRMLNSAIEPACINFEKIINACIEELKYLPNQEKMQYIMNIKDQHTGFYSDELRVTILIKNFISNAIKYRNPKAEGSYLKFDIHITEKEAQILIEDNGLGIEEAYLDKIFDMFFRGTQLSDGSGLGLYIVKQTLDKINGSISVESTINKGTLFKITLANLLYNHSLNKMEAVSKLL